MSAVLAILAALTAGYGIGRYRPARRMSEWSYWQARSPRRSPRWWAVWVICSAENIGWLLGHPVKGWDAWQHRHDPPPPESPPVRIRTTPDHATEEPTP